MILKTVGSLMILLAGGMIGVSCGANLKKRLKQLKQFERIIIMIMGEIRYNNSTIPETLMHVGNRTSEPFKEMLVELNKKLNKYDGKPFFELWKEYVEKYSSKFLFDKNEMDTLRNMGEGMGYLDREMQINSLELSHLQIKKYISDIESTMTNNIKLYNCLGIMGGILVVLIIV